MKNFSAGRWLSNGSHRIFEPAPVDREWSVDDPELETLLRRANRQLARLDLYSRQTHEIDRIAAVLFVEEAVASGRMEGAGIRIEEAVEDEERVSAERRGEWAAVRRYAAALDPAARAGGEPSSLSRASRELHRTLTPEARNEEDAPPGDFRTSGSPLPRPGPEATPSTAPGPERIPALMDDLDAFMDNGRTGLPDLLRIAIAHYQFETIRPFGAGSGQVGRLLLSSHLVRAGLLHRPILPLSEFLGRHRALYHDSLVRVRENDALGRWLRFFLFGVTESANRGIARFGAVRALQQEVDPLVGTLGRRADQARAVLRSLYARPFTDAKGVADAIDRSRSSAYRLIADLEELGILREITGEDRGRRYVFGGYVRALGW